MEKLAKIQKELNAPKNQRNTFGGYNYRSAEDILEAVKPLLDGAVLTLTDEIVLVGERYYVKATATFTDGNFSLSTTAFAREPIEQKGMSDSQLTGTASSYSRKYALNGLFCIDDAKDPDTGEYQKQTSQTAEKPTVEQIVASMSKMTLDTAKKFYARAIELYGKDSAEYKTWVKAWADKKDALEKEQTKQELAEESAFLDSVPDMV